MVAGASMKTTLWLSAVVVGLWAASAPAQETSKAKAKAKGLEGAWEGALKVRPGLELKFILHVEKAKDGALKASLDSPDEGLTELPIDKIAVEKTKVTFASETLKASYEGTWNDDRTGFKGQWTQRGGKFPLDFKKADPAKVARVEVPKELEGLWQGKIDVGGASLRLVLKVEKTKGGTLKASFVSPDQSPMPIPMSSIELKDGELKFACKLIGAKFSGKANKEKTEYAGDFEQAGMKFPLTLKKVDKLSEVRRPQTPKPPFPYNEEKVTYENEAAGVTLAGTLTTPEGPGPVPAVLLITGSGTQDRDETIFGHKPFLVLADALTRRGIAVLRVDDRGIGGSSGDPATATSEDYAGDVLAGVAFLKGRKEIDPKKIGLLGHSEGGVIAPMVAVRSPDVAFIILMAGTGVPGDDLIVKQLALIMKTSGMEDKTIEKQVAHLRKLVQLAKSESDPSVRRDKLSALVKEILAGLPDEERKAGEGSPMTNVIIGLVGSPWGHFFLNYDPRTALRKVRCPVLAINGEKDVQVPAKENLREIAKALHEGGNTRVTTLEFRGLNHLFQTCKTGSGLEYGTIEETIAPEVLKAIGDWVVEQAGPR
jgi:pimeloyl-ACP methyl ester carboxylesterase